MSALLSFAGLRLARTAVNFVPSRTELIGGVVLIVVALSFIAEQLWSST